MGHGKSASGHLNLADARGGRKTAEDAFFARSTAVRAVPAKEQEKR
ncbi:hypothetical protein [Actinomadura sp. K4S16]|nr:hypothetical protein [Actinomadura sp. K4S16]